MKRTKLSCCALTLLLALGLGTETTRAAEPAAADPAPSPLAGFARQGNVPIEITADSLEVIQDDQVAIFTGNVEAVQGDLRLDTANLRVFYGEGNARDQTVPTGSISRLEAEGGVLFASPEESVRGAQAVYDVDRGTITVSGDVVLQQEGNTVRGDRLTIDLNTGRSRIVGVAQNGGRVRGVFVPESGAE